jgi:hypothetical protein
MMNQSNLHRWSQTPQVVQSNPKTLLATVSSCEYESSVVSSSSSAAEPHSEYSSDSSLVAVEEYTSPIASPLLGQSLPQEQQMQQWYPGSVSLSLWEDDDFLSPLHCFMRRYCVEAFSASPDDVKTPRYGKSHGVRVVVGQVGIRCLYCKHRPVGRRPERAVCFPSSVRNIYHSIETWQRRHSLVCTDIAPWVKRSMTELMESSKSRAGGRRQYWEDSAMRLGMIDTAEGVRFSRVPGDLGLAARIPKPIQANKETIMNTTPNSFVVVAGKENNSPTHGTSRQEMVVLPQEELPAEPIVRAPDRQLVTDYLFLLLEQMQTCQFTESDRTGGRSKIKDNDVGFPGMQCLHCRGLSGLGRYFPSSVDALALANSDRNIFNHLQKCRRCPPSIKAELVRQSKQQSQCKNKRGLRKLFFKRVWGRIHGTKGSTSSISS